MKLKRLLITAAVLPALFLFGGVAQANVAFQANTLNSEFFNNFENIYRPSANCGVTQAGAPTCLGTGSGPTGFQLVNQGLTNNLQIGDVIVGIFNVQNIDANGGTIWFSGGQDQFTGYFAQEVAAINNGAGFNNGAGTDPYSGLGVTFDHLTFKDPTTDPFGKLSAGEMFRLYVDSGGGTTAFTSGGGAATTLANVNAKVLADIANATDGTLWASLGTGNVVTTPGVIDTDGFAYGHINLSLSASNISDQEAFLGLNVVLEGPAYNGGILVPINDKNESEVGGTAALHTPIGALINPCLTDPNQPNLACTDFIGSAEIETNPNSGLFFAGGTSGWFFRSNDPFENFVPEPGSLALLGLSLLGFAGLRRRGIV